MSSNASWAHILNLVSPAHPNILFPLLFVLFVFVFRYFSVIVSSACWTGLSRRLLSTPKARDCQTPGKIEKLKKYSNQVMRDWHLCWFHNSFSLSLYLLSIPLKSRLAPVLTALRVIRERAVRVLLENEPSQAWLTMGERKTLENVN